MQHDSIVFRGRYDYATTEALDRALLAARALLVDDDVTEVELDLFGAFHRRGTSLVVDATLPPYVDRYIVTSVLGTLAWHAIEGVVEATRGDRWLDSIPSAA